MKGVGIYVRISLDREGEALGVARQRADCEALCARRDWPVAGIYQDNDVSAYSGKPRPEYQRLLVDLKAGRIDGVVVYDLDRLHRQPRELESFIDTCAAVGVRNIATVSGDIDLSTDNGQLVARMLGAVAKKSSDDTRRRVTRKKFELATAGKVSGGGRRPFGFEIDGKTVRPDEANVIRELARRAVAGDSLGSLCRDLERRGITTSQGHPWRITVMRKMLMSGRIAGLREYRGQVTSEAEWDPIITPTESERLRAVLSTRNPRQRGPRTYLLTGLLRCQRCGSRMESSPHNGRRRYACVKYPGTTGRCGGTFVMAEPVEQYVAEAVFYQLDSGAFRAAAKARSGADEDGALERALQDDQRMLEGLGQRYARHEITEREWDAMRAIIQERIDTARRTLSSVAEREALHVLGAAGTNLRDAWDNLDISRRVTICRAMLSSLEVGPGTPGRNGFDPTRLHPVWKLE